MSRVGQKNIYLCEHCGQGFVAQDVDEGTTPFGMPCLNPECEKQRRVAYSLFYHCPQQMLEKINPAIEFYHPSPEEYATLSVTVKAHVDHFRLISRRTNGPKE